MASVTYKIHNGQIWIMCGDRVIIYINENGSIMTPGDIVSTANIPSPPQ